MLADLWNAPHAAHAVGTATTGSSEAIQLGGLAMKRIWQDKCKAAGKSIHDPGPNIVMGMWYAFTSHMLFFTILDLTTTIFPGSNAQVALEKLFFSVCYYFHTNSNSFF